MRLSRRHAVISLLGGAALAVGGMTPALASSGGAPGQGGFQSTSSTAHCNDGTVAASPAILWPPNHKLNTISITYSESDGDSDTLNITNVTETMVDGSGAVGVEGHGAGQPAGQQGPDYVGPSAYTSGTDGGTPASTSVQIRSERAGTVGNGSGRVYSLIVSCRDSGGGPDANDPAEATGQSGMGTVYVCVPHDMSDASLSFCRSQTGA